MSERMTMAQRQELVECMRIYRPCNCGIHVCGSDDEKNAAVTVGNIPARDQAEARAIFEAAKAEAACGPDEPWDLVVDLNLDHNNLHVEDFCITRQMLDRCLAAGRAALTGEST